MSETSQCLVKKNNKKKQKHRNSSAFLFLFKCTVTQMFYLKSMYEWEWVGVLACMVKGINVSVTALLPRPFSIHTNTHLSLEMLILV